MTDIELIEGLFENVKNAKDKLGAVEYILDFSTRQGNHLSRFHFQRTPSYWEDDYSDWQDGDSEHEEDEPDNLEYTIVFESDDKSKLKKNWWIDFTLQDSEDSDMKVELVYHSGIHGPLERYSFLIIDKDFVRSSISRLSSSLHRYNEKLREKPLEQRYIPPRVQ